MTALLVFLRMAWPYLACLGIGLGTGGYLVGNHWQAKYEALQAGDALARADGEASVRKTLQVQLAQAQAVSTNNSTVIEKLQNENAQIAADRDANMVLARRLLAGQARQAPAGGHVSQASDRPAAPAASGTGQDESLAGLLVSTADECERNADRLDALIGEIRPQL